MKKRILILLSLVFFSLSCSQDEIDWQVMSGMETHFQDEINRLRTENGLNPLKYSPIVHEQSKRYAAFLADNEKHFYQVVRDEEILQKYYTNVKTQVSTTNIDGCAAFSSDPLDPGGTAFLTLSIDPTCKGKLLSQTFTHIGVGSIQAESGTHFFSVFLISSTTD